MIYVSNYNQFGSSTLDLAFCQWERCANIFSFQPFTLKLNQTNLCRTASTWLESYHSLIFAKYCKKKKKENTSELQFVLNDFWNRCWQHAHTDGEGERRRGDLLGCVLEESNAGRAWVEGEDLDLFLLPCFTRHVCAIQILSCTFLAPLLWVFFASVDSLVLTVGFLPCTPLPGLYLSVCTTFQQLGSWCLSESCSRSKGSKREGKIS